MGVLADAGKNIEHFAAVRRGILHAVRSEQRQSIMFCQIDQALIDLFFAADEMALDFNVDIVVTERVDKNRAVRVFRMRKKRNKAFGKFFELIPTNETSSFFTAQMRLRQ